MVVSVDEGGTIVARDSTRGQVVAAPLPTGIEGTRALAAWLHGDNVHVATGAGSHYVSDGNLRRWDVTVGTPLGPPIQAHNSYVHFISKILLRGREVLVTYGPPGMLRIWRPHDGALLVEIATGISSKVSALRHEPMAALIRSIPTERRKGDELLRAAPGDFEQVIEGKPEWASLFVVY